MNRMDAPPHHRPAHIGALDGLRGIAILLVIPHNADIFSNSAAWLWPAALLAHAGWIGVQLFFVLSGFLITRNLLDSRDAGNYFRAFYWRRVLRIFPLYYLTLIAGLVLAPRISQLGSGAPASHQNQVWLWTFLSNWAQPLGLEVSGFSHFWSLAIEEQFYLLWPGIVLLLAGPRLIWMCAGLVAVAFVSRLVLLHQGANPDMVYMFTVCRMDALAIGAAAAVLELSGRCTRWLGTHSRAALGWSAAVLIILAVTSHAYAVYDRTTLTIGYPLMAAAFAAVILVLAAQARGLAHWLNRLLSMGWLRSVGRYSFAMYVFHLPLLVIFGDQIRRVFAFTGSALPLVYALVAILLSYVAGFLSYHLIEKHFLRLKHLVTPRTRAELRTEP